MGFLQLTPLSAQVLGYLAEQKQSRLDDILNWLQGIYPQMQPELLTQGCIQLLEQLAVKGIVRGI